MMNYAFSYETDELNPEELDGTVGGEIQQDFRTIVPSRPFNSPYMPPPPAAPPAPSPPPTYIGSILYMLGLKSLGDSYEGR